MAKTSTSTNAITNFDFINDLYIQTVETFGAKKLKKVDFSRASKKLSERVNEYFRVFMLKPALEMEHDEMVESLEHKYSVIRGSLHEDKLSEELRHRVELLNKELEALIKEEALWSYSMGENAIIYSYKGGKKNRFEGRDEIRAYFKAYDLDIANTDFEAIIMLCLNDVRRASQMAIAKNGGTSALKCGINGKSVMQTVFAVTFEFLLSMGYTNAIEVPQIYNDRLAQMKAEAKARRADRKASEKANK